MKKIIGFIIIVIFFTSCSSSDSDETYFDNPELSLHIPTDFPEVNSYVSLNKPTKYGAELGEKLFSDKRFSKDNTISCSSCHIQANAFADHNAQAIGIEGRVGLRNAPPLQNLMFLKFFNWDGSRLQLETQPLVPIITHEEMDSSILEVIGKIKDDASYKEMFKKTFGDQEITADRIYKSIAQFEYTLISANSKYDKVKRKESQFTENEAAGYATFQQKCASCHSTELFTDQSFRNIGFPLNTDSNEAGRGRVTGIATDFMSFRVPSLRNVEYTAPYGSFGQFATLKSVLDYFDNGVLNAANLDPIFKNNGNRIPLTEVEKENLIAFMKTLSDREFTGN
ncbi:MULTISPECIES: cytochrome-c peroxidase [Flavobacterium]|uniref:Cytochrome c peroxidase n=1 Tax=Flavobacterium ginsengisoli TaxID=871694 RepID=A0ABP7FL98_9FLAO|nr:MULTISPECIES: cytochrome-c peroxidase [Flavobacterium]MBJ2124453.1 cytochrome-c peroxidase [Flavobacterium sp. IB48]